jgi:hypothetical protein
MLRHPRSRGVAPANVKRSPARHGARRATLLAVAALFLAVGSTAEPSNPPCIAVWGEARYRNLGYDHIVHVGNHCSAAAVCDVSTDVNPEPQRFTIPPGQEIEVLTYRGSPSSEFQPRVACGLVL